MTLKEWRLFIENALSNAGFQNAFDEAKWLLSSALEQENSFVTLNPTYTPSSLEAAKIEDWLKRRLKGEPLSRMKGIREFWSLPFHLNEHTLDPRPETEVIVEGVLKWVGQRTLNPWRILDLGTGSGCLLIALLHELKRATGIGVDMSKDTLSMAQKNAVINGVGHRATFLESHWGKGLEGTFDIIVSNPPYIPLREKESLEKSVRDYDPPQALFGGENGIDCYRILSQDIKPLMMPQSLVVLEIGAGQRKDVEELFQTAGFHTLFILKDLAGIERTIGFGL